VSLRQGALLDRDPVRAQIADRAHEILSLAGFFVAPGFRKDPEGQERFSYGPNFRGVPTAAWQWLFANRNAEFWELIAICERDYGTWCALLAKVVIKGGGQPQPYIWNKPQRRLNALRNYLVQKQVALWIIVLKARQMGITTDCSQYQYWQNWRKPNVVALFLGDKAKLLERRIQIVNSTHDNLPDVGNIRPTLRADNKLKGGKLPKSEVYFTSRGSKPWNSATDTIVAKNPSSVLGFQGTHVNCSEAAFWNGNGEGVLFDILEALTPQLPQRSSPNYLQSSLTVESTPNGMNDFHDLWDENKDPDIPNRKWYTCFLPWWIYDDEFAVEPPDDWDLDELELKEQKKLTKFRMADEGREVTRAQMYWRHLIIRDECGGDPDIFDVWYVGDEDTCFRAASGSVFKDDAFYLRECVTRAEEDAPKMLAEAKMPPDEGHDFLVGHMAFDDMPTPFGTSSRYPNQETKLRCEFIRDRKGALTLWEVPIRGHIYTIGGDCSGGTGNDGACAHIACVTCGRQAGELYNNWLDPNDFADQCVHLGWWYNGALFNPEVNNLGGGVLKRAMSDWQYPFMCPDEAWDEAKLKPHKYGFSTSEHSKPVMINYARGMISGRHYRIASRRLLREMANFYYLGLTSYGEQRMGGGRSGNAHDDSVLAWCLAMWAVRQTPPGIRADFETKRFAIPTASQLGMNETAGQGLFYGRGLVEDQYGDYEVPEAITRLFEVAGGFDDEWSSACPMQVGWQGMGMGM
jgi:hypothetical protein